MATIEKLIKAFEALKVFQPAVSAVEEVVVNVKKKEQPLNKNEKIANCNLVADCICAPNMRSVADFPKFLGIAMETFLTLCDDPEADIRMVADECLNRSIKTLLETNLGRLQVELYKEIKKNGSPRCLRAALWRFADMAHLIRPQKCRPYIVNLLPCLGRICKREDESIQETLMLTMQKICPALMVFANDTEVKVLLKAFLPNLSSSVASCRRTAATSSMLICQHSRSPQAFVNFLLINLLDLVLPVDVDHEIPLLLGVIQCLKNIIPVFSQAGSSEEGMKGSFGETKKNKETTLSKEQLLKVYQLLLYHTGHPDHNVVTVTLEALLQVLRTPPPGFREILITNDSIKETTIYKKDMPGLLPGSSLSEVPSTSALSTTSEDTGLYDESEISEIKPAACPASDIGSLDSAVYMSSNAGSMDEVTGSIGGQRTEKSPDSDNDDGVMFVANTAYSGIEIGDIQEDQSQKSNLSNVPSGSQDTLLSIKSLSPGHVPQPQPGIGQDMNGNPEIIVDNGNDDPVTAMIDMCQDDVDNYIGSVTEGVPLCYCVRLICRGFLLTRTKGVLVPDRQVRVSVKSLALGSLACALTQLPRIFLEKLFTAEIEGVDDPPDIKDIFLYASHPDPQLRGHTTVIIGNCINTILIEGRGDFTKWLQHNSPGGLESVTLESLVEVLLSVSEDSSSVAARLSVGALKLCLPRLLHSCHSDVGLRGLLKLLRVKNDSYWLVKFELLELIQCLDFKVIHHLEKVCETVKRGSHHYLGELCLQERFLEEIVLPFLGDEDGRVRQCAALTLVRMVRNLYYPLDHLQQDAVIALASSYTDHFLSPIMHEWSQPPPPLVQGLVRPYHVTQRGANQHETESSLSRVVMNVLKKLQMSNLRHLTSGCCLALCLLSEEYQTSIYPHAWGCGTSTPLVPKETTQKSRRPPTRSLSSSSTLSLEELTSGSGGLLPIILSLLTSSPVTLDLSSHQSSLQLAGNLIAGSVYQCLRCPDPDHSKTEPATAEENVTWSGLSNRALVPLIDHLLIHVARVLNVFAHVIDELVPGPPQIKTSLPSLPQAPSLSPIKRKARGEKDTGSNSGTTSQDTKASQKQSQKDKEKELEKERNKKEGLGTFYTLPHYVKLYETLKGAYSNYKISLDLTSSDKFCTMLKTTLHVLSQILEVATLTDIGKHAEEFLSYLRTTVSLEPTDSVLCVQQLLKALFGTNLCSQWEEQYTSAFPWKPSKTSKPSHAGLYHYTFSQPYAIFTQSLATATIKAVSPDHEDSSGVLTWLRKCVERKIPAILKPSSKADKTAIAAYIRLFEPLVIKALKQYTVTSSLELQEQVLDLLSQLVQLRVNYCLLDSDQVFIGFVIRQFEYIEEGQIRNSEILIPHIFNFLVMLSYEKFHSKTIISMPKIIQLCDGIMASGLHPTTHAIPALQPIVHDLFLLRGANKSDISKELETQREVLVSMLLRLINYYQALEMFVLVLQQCHRESEERWKRLSRQVTDILLPALAKQQINLNSQIALDVVHRLFESVAPIVFRPVDILLKTLLMSPADITSGTGLERWLCLVLSILRVLMAQTKEEVVLSRIQELGIKLHVFKVSESDIPEAYRSKIAGLSPEYIMAWFLLNIIGKTVSMVNNLSLESKSCDFLCKQLSHLLMYITHMFQSGLFRRIAAASMKIIHQETMSCCHDVKEINKNFLLLGMSQPTLTLQYCNVLILLNFNDQGFWSEVIGTPKRKIMSGSIGGNSVESAEETTATRWCCCNREILRRGGLILFCDYACENLNDSEHMTWVLINHVKDLIELAYENPVQDFISAIHRNSSASSLFIQAIHARWENVNRPSVIYKTLKCLEAVHPSQSGALLILLIDKFLNTHHLSVARLCDTIACRRLELLLADSIEEGSKQLPVEDLDKLLTFMDTNKLNVKHMRLSSLLHKLREKISGGITQSFESAGESKLHLLEGSALTVDKACYLTTVKEQCFCSCPEVRECAYLLQHLDYADMLMIMMTKEFNLATLEECISFGAYKTIQRHSREAENPSPDGAHVDWVFDPLFQASQLTLMRHINNIINQLPVPHQILCFSDSVSEHSPYMEKMEDFFMDHSCVEEIYQLTAALVQYLTGLARFPWKPAVPKECQNDICRFCTLCLECVCWSVRHNSLPTSSQLGTSLHCLSLVLQNHHLSSVIGQRDHVTWVCSITHSLHQLVSSLLLLPGEQLCSHSRLEETPVSGSDPRSQELYQLTAACDEISELVQYLHTQQTLDHTFSLSKLPAFMSGLVANIILGLSRIPVLNSFSRTPPIVWKMGWIPTPVGDPPTKLPPLPVDLMHDKEVLREFIFRINSIGWISRQQFEETWMSLLGVLVPVTPEHPLPIEEDIERTHCMVLTVRAITGMLTQTILVPSPGNPGKGTFDVQPRDKPLGFLHTRCGKKLSVIRGIVEQEVQNMMLHRVQHVEHNGGVKYKFDHNLERETAVDDYNLGQICVESIWSVVGVLDTNLSESDTTDSLESPPPHPQDVTLLQNLGSNPVPEQEGVPREQTSSLGDLDVHSCLQFLLELYRQWLLPGTNGKPALMLLNEVIKSVVSLSDLFAEREQYDWMLDTLFEVYKAHPGEDEIAMQYLNVGVCKAAAVVGVDSTTADKLVKIIANGLKSTHLSSKVSTLHGCLYLLEAAIPEVNKLLVPALTEFLLKAVGSIGNQSISSQKYSLTLWATTFYIIENCTTDLKDGDFTSQILQMAVSTASSSEDSVSSVVYVAILKGLERLLLTDVLTPQDAEVIVKLSVDRLCLPSPQRALAALGLLFTCMYSGKQYDQYSPRPREQEAFNLQEPSSLYQDPESLIVAMERVTVLFDRIKKGYPYEARVIARVLPAFLADFFPPQDIMNKVIGEFLSSQQPYPQLIAKVVFQVFSNLHDQRQQGLLKDWVMLSLSNFTQRSPVSMAMWSLTCFFISASTNTWLRNLFSYVLSRMGKIEIVDKRLFCLAAIDFYLQISDTGKKRSFVSTFQSVAAVVPESPYKYLLDCLAQRSENQGLAAQS